MVGLVEFVEVASEPELANGITFLSFSSFIVLEQIQRGREKARRSYWDFSCWGTIYVMPVFMYSRVTSKSPPSFRVQNFSTRLANITVLLTQSFDCKYYVSRTLLAPQPGLPNSLGPDVVEFVKLILLYVFVRVCLSVGHFFLKSHCFSVALFPLVL